MFLPHAVSVFKKLHSKLLKLALFLALVPAWAGATTTEVGAMPGAFSVSAGGAATYSIPIKLPPGAAGLAPQLSLIYNSGLGNGLAGYGWSLGGLSAISACGKTWAQDGVNADVDFSGNSVNNVCLDGRRLFALTTGSNIRRKELDDFSVVTEHDNGGAGPVPTIGPQYFTVQTIDGMTYTYGKTADSEVVAVGPGVPSGVTVVRVWALDSVSDKYGNSIDFTYQQDNTNGDYWPVGISYTDHNGSPGVNKVVFKYTSLASISPALVWNSYLAGALQSETQRLNEIDVDQNGSQAFVYTLGYQNTLTDGSGNIGTERSELTSVQECAGSVCFPQTKIGWQNGTSGWDAGHAANMGGNAIPSSTASAVQLLDVNGDGLADIVYAGPSDWMVMVANGSGFAAPVDSLVPVTSANASSAMVISLYGGSQPSTQGLLVPQQNSSGTLDWYLLTPVLSGQSFVKFSASDTGVAATGAGGNATLMDLNGDGLQDIVFSDGVNLQWEENLGGVNLPASPTATPGSFAGAQTVMAGEFSGGGNDIVQYQREFAGETPDFDGTGRGSFMLYTEKSSGPGCSPDYCPPPTAPTPIWSFMEGGGYNSNALSFGKITGSPGNLVTPLFVDFNGDGISDALYADGSAIDGSNWTWQTFTSNGTSIKGGDTGIPWQSSVMSDALAVDYSGNGRQQVLLALNNTNGVCQSLGLVGYEGGVFQGGTSIGMGNEGPCASSYYSGSLRTADIDGDGLQDLIWVAGGTVYYAFHNGLHPDVVTSISNGFNQTYNITYGNLDKGAAYTPGPANPATAAFTGVGTVNAPESRVVTGAMYVVTGYTANDGVGGTHKVSESYANALIDMLGHGFLGFASTSTSDVYGSGSTATTILANASFNQLFPLSGRASSSTVSVNGNTESSISTTWVSMATTNGAQYVYANSSQSSAYAIGATSPYEIVTTTTTPTLSGSPDYVLSKTDSTTTTSPKSISSETVTNFAFDDLNWCLALPTSVTTTNTDQTTLQQLQRTATFTNDTQHCRVATQTASVVDGSVTQSITITPTYDSIYGLLQQSMLTATNAGVATNYTTSYGYDSTNTFVTSVTNALGEKSTSIWNPILGVKLSDTDPNNITVSYGYDAFGLSTGETGPDGTSVQEVYCLPANNCIPSTGAYAVTATHYSATSQAGATTTTAYDSFFRPLHQSTYLLGTAQTNVDTSYDALGRVVSVSTPYTGSPTTYVVDTYDVFSRPSTIYTPAGQESGCTHTPPSPFNGEVACTVVNQYNQGTGLTTITTDAAGKVSSAVTNALGELVAETDAVGTSASAETQYAYDPFGDLVQTTDADGNVTSMTYDTAGRKLSMTDPDMGSWTYVYDPRGLMLSQTDAKGQTISLTFDALGRALTRTMPLAAGGTGTDTWTYDGAGGAPTAPFIGKPYSTQGADGYLRQYQYDTVGRPSEVDTTISGMVYATNTSYDSFGRVASVTYPTTPTADADDPPVANAGSNQAVLVGQNVTLNGTASYDPDNGPQPLSYAWSELSGPSTIATVNNATTATVTFSTTVAGTYNFQLTVSDGQLTNSALVTVTMVPTQGAGLTATAVNQNTGAFTLNWSTTTGAATYAVEQSLNGGAFSNLPQTYSTPSAPISGYGSGAYTFGVQGCDSTGKVCGTYSPTTNVTVLRTPGIPGTPGASPDPATNSNAYTLTWTPSSGTVSYYVVYSSSNGTTYDSGTNVGSNNSWPTSNNVNGTYYYKVAACVTGNGLTSCSSTGGVGTETVNLPVPSASMGASPSSISPGGSSTLSWTWQGSVGASSYVLTSLTGVVLYSGSGTSYVVSPSVTKTYYVSACNIHGCGAKASATVTVVQSGCGRICNLVEPEEGASEDFGVLQPLQVSLTELEPLAAPAASAGPLSDDAGATVAVMSGLRAKALANEEDRLLAQQRLIADRAIPANPAARDRSTLFAAQVASPGQPRLMSAQSALAAGLVQPRALRAVPRVTGGTERYTVNYVYDSHENLVQVVDAANPSLVYWQANSADAFGHVTAATFANGVITTRAYDPNTGMLQGVSAGVGTSSSVLQQLYTWDADGNLGTRQDVNAGLTETFTYDGNNRLTQAVTSGGATGSVSVNYDALGNILSKSDVGTYSYSPTKPMQIASITPSSGPVRNYQYDSNGNLNTDSLRNYSWDALNRATQITTLATGAVQQFAYTPDGARYLEATNSGGTTTNLTEVNALFQVYAAGGHIYDREYIMSSDGAVAVRAVREDGVLTTRYISTDHLGSTSAITDEAGHLDSTESYDAFGQRRNPANWQTYACGSAPDNSSITDKGYTGQQELGASCLVHMNGRVYDPQVGRMVSADPTIPDPTFSQAFNRYAYVYNNPFAATDPSGYDPNGGEPATDSHGVYQCFAGCGKNQVIIVGGTNIQKTSINNPPSPTPDNDTQVDTDTTSISDPSTEMLLSPALTQIPLQQVAPPQETTIAQDSAVHNSNNPDSGQDNNNLNNPGGDDGLYQSPGAKNMAGGGDGWNSASGVSMVGLGMAPAPSMIVETTSPKPNLGSGPTASQNRGTAPKGNCQGASCFNNRGYPLQPLAKPVTILGLLLTAADTAGKLKTTAQIADVGRLAGTQKAAKAAAIAALGIDLGKLRYDLNASHRADGITLAFDRMAVTMDFVGLFGGKYGTLLSAIYSAGDLSLEGGFEGAWRQGVQNYDNMPADAWQNCNTYECQ